MCRCCVSGEIKFLLVRRYGLVYPGVGWVLFRSKEYLPDSLIFHGDTLSTAKYTFLGYKSLALKPGRRIFLPHEEPSSEESAGHTKFRLKEACHASLQ